MVSLFAEAMAQAFFLTPSRVMGTAARVSE
jgi:hypothetical protein